jgi:predicted phage tail protein
MLFPASPALSLLTWAVIVVALMYFARLPVHAALFAFGRTVHRAMRLAAHSVKLAAARLKARNEEVLLESGKKAIEIAISREYERVEKVIERDIGTYPELHRRLSDNNTKIEADYQASIETPPPPPEWVKAVDTLAKIKAGSDPMVAKMLGDIKGTIEKAQGKATDEYRKATRERLSALKALMPLWRTTNKLLDTVDAKITGLFQHARKIDENLAEYKEMDAKSDKALRTLSSSSLTQFFIAGIVLAIAVGGIIINFNLIAYPMQEMVGGNSYIGPVKTADVAALVVILLELAMGLFLMESLKITHLLPIIGAMDDRMRTRMLWTTFTLLLILAGIESSLAYMRDILAAESASIRQHLLSGEAVQMNVSMIPLVGQMVMGFVFPFVLAFTAIPLESFIHSLRTLLGLLIVALLLVLAALLRLAGTLFQSLAKLLVALYDLVIFAPLWAEKKLKKTTK